MTCTRNPFAENLLTVLLNSERLLIGGGLYDLVFSLVRIDRQIIAVFFLNNDFFHLFSTAHLKALLTSGQKKMLIDRSVLVLLSCLLLENLPKYCHCLLRTGGGGRVVRWCWVNIQCRGVLLI